MIHLLTEIDLYRINQAIDESGFERENFTLPTIVHNHDYPRQILSYDISSKDYPEFKFNFKFTPDNKKIIFRYTKETLVVSSEGDIRENLGMNVLKWINHLKEYVRIKEFNNKKPKTQLEVIADKLSLYTDRYYDAKKIRENPAIVAAGNAAEIIGRINAHGKLERINPAVLQISKEYRKVGDGITGPIVEDDITGPKVEFIKPLSKKDIQEVVENFHNKIEPKINDIHKNTQPKKWYMKVWDEIFKSGIRWGILKITGSAGILFALYKGVTLLYGGSIFP